MAAGFLSQSDLTYLSSAVGITGRLVLLTVSEGQSSAIVDPPPPKRCAPCIINDMQLRENRANEPRVFARLWCLPCLNVAQASLPRPD